MTLEKDMYLKSQKGAQIQILEHIGGGAQGEVYKIKYNGKIKALKWFNTFNKDVKKFYTNLLQNIQRGSPDKSFLWPDDLVETKDGSFGSTMEYKPTEYHELTEFMKTKPLRFSSFQVAIDCCIKLVSSFRILHNNGLCYHDMSDGNFTINPKTGDILILDNENVSPNQTNMGILGTPGYIAPEVLLGKTCPTKQSDRYSLAVIIFMIIGMNHPFNGRAWARIPCFDAQASTEFYSNAPFIYDVEDKSNAPIPSINQNVVKIWPYLPKYMKDTFRRAFCKEVLLNPQKRISEREWLEILCRFRNDVVKCKCGNEVFLDGEKLLLCEKCNSEIKSNNYFSYNNTKIAIFKGTKLYRCQLGITNIDHTLDSVVNVIANPNNNAELWIENQTGSDMKIITPSGKTKIVSSYDIFPVLSGLQFNAFDTTIIIK